MFLLRPSDEVNEIVGYFLAVLSKERGLLLHAITALSNHTHEVLTDPRGQIVNSGGPDRGSFRWSEDRRFGTSVVPRADRGPAEDRSSPVAGWPAGVSGIPAALAGYRPR
jgi:hypothetical protein